MQFRNWHRDKLACHFKITYRYEKHTGVAYKFCTRDRHVLVVDRLEAIPSVPYGLNGGSIRLLDFERGFEGGAMFHL